MFLSFSLHYNFTDQSGSYKKKHAKCTRLKLNNSILLIYDWNNHLWFRKSLAILTAPPLQQEQCNLLKKMSYY